MVFGRIFRPTRDAALAQSALEQLSDWAERAWQDHGAELFGNAELEGALSELLSNGADYARERKELDHTNNPAIARALLLGILRTESHSRAQLESALGLPFPHDT